MPAEIAGAAFLLSVLRALRQLPSPSQVAAAASVALGTQTLEERIGRLGNVERTMFARLLSHQTWAADPNQAFDAQATFGDRVADRVASFGGRLISMVCGRLSVVVSMKNVRRRNATSTIGVLSMRTPRRRFFFFFPFFPSSSPWFSSSSASV